MNLLAIRNKAFADFTFHPRRKNDTAFIVELKKDEDPEVAINQIKEKEYVVFDYVGIFHFKNNENR